MHNDIASDVRELHTKLGTLVDNPMRLDRDRTRFNSRPYYISYSSGTTTQEPSPVDSTDPEWLWEEKKWQLIRECDASVPSAQFNKEVDVAEKRTIEKLDNRTLSVPPGTNLYKFAYDAVKQSWVEQGIWRDEWDGMPHGRWMHERSPEPPLDGEPNSDGKADSHRGHLLNLFSFGRERPGPKSAQKARENSEKASESNAPRGIRKCKDASRPFARFIHQISEERKRLEPEPAYGTTSEPLDINTRAYENVKQDWMKRGLWDDGWGTLPGMTWKHERPLQLPPYPTKTKPCDHENISTSGDAPVRSRSPLFRMGDPPGQPTVQASDSGARKGRKRRASKSPSPAPRRPEREANPFENGRRRSKRLRARASEAGPVTSTDSPPATRASQKKPARATPASQKKPVRATPASQKKPARATPAGDKRKSRGGPRSKGRK